MELDGGKQARKEGRLDSLRKKREVFFPSFFLSLSLPRLREREREKERPVMTTMEVVVEAAAAAAAMAVAGDDNNDKNNGVANKKAFFSFLSVSFTAILLRAWLSFSLKSDKKSPSILLFLSFFRLLPSFLFLLSFFFILSFFARA